MSPQGWQTQRFADIADYKAGRTPARAKSEYWQDAQNDVPWITISDMTEFGIITETKEKITEVAFQKIFHGKMVPAGTLVMSFKLTIGRVATLGIDACHNEAIISIYPREGVDQRFLGYFLSQIDYDLIQDRQVKGNTLNQSKINQIEIWLPPYDEQTQIVDILDSIRKAIQIQERGFAASQELKHSTMHALFKKGVHEGSQKETRIGLIPKDWEVVEIGQLFEIIQGLSLKGNLSDDGDGIPFLRTSNVYWSRIDLDSVSRMNVDADRIGDRTLEPGDLLVCEGGEIGRAAVWNGEMTHCTYQNHLHRLRAKQADRIDTKFTAAWLEEGFLHRDVYAGVGNRTTIPNLSRARLAELSIPCPPLEEQSEIVAILDAIDRKIDLHRRKRAVLDDLFKTLLRKLMTGEIRASDLDLSASKRDVFGSAEEDGDVQSPSQREND